MTDEEYIRDGIKLADGWDADRLGNQRIQVYCPHGQGGEHPLTIVGYSDQQHVKDALAAQLVRQVEELDCEAIMDAEGCRVLDPYGRSIGSYFGSDRTMNIIKTIVDIGVLCTGDSNE